MWVCKYLTPTFILNLWVFFFILEVIFFHQHINYFKKNTSYKYSLFISYIKENKISLKHYKNIKQNKKNNYYLKKSQQNNLKNREGY